EIGPEHIIRRISGKEIRSIGNLYRFLEPGELLAGIPQHAVFQQFWAQARADCFAPPQGIAELRWSKLVWTRQATAATDNRAACPFVHIDPFPAAYYARRSLNPA